MRAGLCQCRGTESNLQDCLHSSVHDCGVSEGAGVVCQEAEEDDEDNCLEYDVSYIHPGNRRVSSTTATSAVECQTKCINQDGCDHFTFNKNITTGYFFVLSETRDMFIVF